MMLRDLSSLSLAVAGFASAVAAGADSQAWSGWGGNIFNNRWANSHDITATNIPTLTRKCYLTYQYGVSATPVIVDTTVYYPTWNGSFVALDYTTCRVQWMLNVTAIIYDFGPLDAQQTRGTLPGIPDQPQIDDDILFFGTQSHALVVAVNRHTGAVLDTLQLNTHPLAVITLSPTLYKSTLFIGASSYEEPAPLLFPSYKCCTFIGNAAAVTFNRHTSKLTLKWSVPTLPPPANHDSVGWSGAGVWGSQPSIDARRDQVFFATGNVYSFPPAYAHCASENETSDSCLPQGVNQEAVLAVDARSGRVNWVRRLNRMDAWNGACVTDPVDVANCPSQPPGADADFGMAPAFVPAAVSGLAEDVVVVGQKNGVVYALGARDGRILYARNVSPDGDGGGISWGVAMDDQRVYFTLPYSKRGVPRNVSTTLYGALGLKSGRVEWRTPATLKSNSLALTAPTVAGDLVLYARAGVITKDGSIADYDNSIGGLVVIDKRTGKIVYEKDLDTTFQGGIAVQGRHLLFGTGYRNGISYLGNGSLWVMEVGGLQHHGK